MKQLGLWMSLKFCGVHYAAKEKWKYHSLLLFFLLEYKGIKCLPGFFRTIFEVILASECWVMEMSCKQPYLVLPLWEDESRSDVLPSLLSVFLHMLLSCSLSILTSCELFFLLGCYSQFGYLTHLEGQFPKRQRLYGISRLVFGGKICLSTPLRTELIVRTLKFRWEHCCFALVDFSIFCITSAIVL